MAVTLGERQGSDPLDFGQPPRAAPARPLVGRWSARARDALFAFAASLRRRPGAQAASASDVQALVAARNAAEAALDEAERRYRGLIDSMGVAVYTTDTEGRLTLYNSAAATLWGCRPALGDARFCGAWKLWTPDGQPLPHDECPMAVALRENRAVLGGEAVAERPDGARVPFAAYPAPIRDPSGALVGAVNVLMDITLRKSLEQRITAANAELALLSSTDALTGLANRRHFDAALAKEWSRAERDRHPLSVLLLDADSFKAYNDAYGHPAGDEALKAIGACIQGNLHRPNDLAARYGGEEFAAILPNTGLPGAVVVAEEIRRTVAGRALPHRSAASGFVSVSVGVASAVPHHGETAASLVERADAALYEAKRRGRDRTEARPAPRAALEGVAA